MQQYTSKHGTAYKEHPAMYRSYYAMLSRCYNKKHKSYKYYGARGITVCDRWIASFWNYYEDCGDRPKPLTLDRIDNDGNYEPGNVRWATPKVQSKNSRGAINRNSKYGKDPVVRAEAKKLRDKTWEANNREKRREYKRELSRRRFVTCS